MDASGAHVSLRDWRLQESGMTLKVKRKKKLKKEGERRGSENRRMGECGGAEREEREGEREGRRKRIKILTTENLQEVGSMDA